MTLDDVLKEVDPILCGSGSFEFTHPSFQEFLTARYLFQCIAERNAGELSGGISRNLLELVAQMNPPKNILYDLIFSTRNMKVRESVYLGGNCLTLLKLLGEEFHHKDFSGTNIFGADLSDCNLEGLNLRGAFVRNVSFDYSNLHNLEFGYSVNHIIGTKNIKKVEIFGYDGKNGTVYMINDLGSLIQWELNHGETKRIKRVIDPEMFKWFAMPYNLCLSQRRDRLLVCKRRTGRGPLVEVVGLNKGSKVFVNNLSTLGTVSAFSFSPDGRCVAVAQQPIERDACLTLLDHYSGKIHLQEFFPKGVYIHNVSISPNNRYVVCDLSGGEPDSHVSIINDRCSEGTRDNYGRIRIFEITNKNELLPFFEGIGYSEPYRKSWFSADSRFCLLNNGAIFSMEKRDYVSQITHYRSGFQFFTHDGRYVVHLRWGDDRGAFINEIETGKEYDLGVPGDFKSISDMVLSNDDSTVAVKYFRVEDDYPKIAFCNLDLDNKRLIPFHTLDVKSFSEPKFY